MTQAGLSISGLHASLGERKVLHGLDFDIPAGELLCVLGPNGAGKTTLLRAIMGSQPCQGSIRWGGETLADLPPRARARLVAYLPQGGTVGWPLPVGAVVALGRLPHGRTLDTLSPADRAAIMGAMEKADLLDFASRPATALSGGERARVLLARALAVEAQLLLADEPVASLDPRHQLGIMKALRDEARRGRTVIAVLHDLALAARFADRIALLQDGRLAGLGRPAEVLTPDQLKTVFGISVVREEHGGQTLLVPWDVVPG
jgi:iron complex transport system ATP-binding protein